MNSEKVMTQIVSSAGRYTAPKVKVKELRHRSVICASQKMGSEDDSAGWTD